MRDGGECWAAETADCADTTDKERNSFVAQVINHISTSRNNCSDDVVESLHGVGQWFQRGVSGFQRPH